MKANNLLESFNNIKNLVIFNFFDNIVELMKSLKNKKIRLIGTNSEP